jgi:hypothetical protein
MKTIIETFRIKSVEPKYFTSQNPQKRKEAGSNLFGLKGGGVIINLLTDDFELVLNSMKSIYPKHFRLCS